MPGPADAEFAVASKAGGGEVETLRANEPVVPVAGVQRSALASTFDDVRGGGRRHEAMDILAPRGTPVVAAVDGRIVKLFTSAAGGLTIYQFDAEDEFCYYYAHLDSYATNLSEGEFARRGQTIGYVGTTGNAPPETPHLHFAIFKLGPDKRWWEGDPIDPFLVLR
jgi:peptidoglycan LD-endopeptidase LytH